MRTFAPLPDRVVQRQKARALFERYALLHHKRAPKPEIMFETLVRRGFARVVRRRGKPPLLEFNRYL